MKVLCTNGLKTVLEEVVPGFQRSVGTTVEATYASTNQLLATLNSGARADLALLTLEAIERLIAQGAVIAGSRVGIANSAIGIAVRKGAPRPNIGTVEALKGALLAAKSVAHSRTGISGLYAPELFKRLGIAEEMTPKSVVPDPITVGEAVARGEAEIAFQQISELMPVSGVDVLGPLPAQVQKLTVFAAGLFADATQPAAARALVQHLISPAARPLYSRMGLTAV